MCAPLYIQTSTWALDCSTLEELVQGTSVGTFWGPKDNLDKSRPPPVTSTIRIVAILLYDSVGYIVQ